MVSGEGGRGEGISEAVVAVSERESERIFSCGPLTTLTCLLPTTPSCGRAGDVSQWDKRG